MIGNVKLSFFTLLLMISFAAVNAVLFSAALPNIANFFSIPDNTAQLTITWFLIGYTLGQLLYGPLANRFGRKPALYAGITLQILSSLICAFSGIIHVYGVLVLGRFLLALGSGVGLKMAFTLVNECYEPITATQKISYLIIAFAIAPSLSTAVGGILNIHFGWESCFYAGAIYGFILLFFISRLPETLPIPDYNALKIKYLIQTYATQFKNYRLVAGGLLLGASTSFIYVFAAVSPFIAISLFHYNSQQYGLANIIPSIGLFFGPILSAKLAKKYPLALIIRLGILITSGGILLMFICMLLNLSVIYSLFFTTIVIFFGLCLVLPSASTIALSQVSDKSQGSAVMNFINIGFATIGVLGASYFSMRELLLPTVFLVLCIGMLVISQWLVNKPTST
jgi:DHA1 family bicyclomycin/chloramphenicol resistance-like MFS transporter